MTEKNHIDLPSEKKGVWLTLVILSFFTLLSIIILYFIFINNYKNISVSEKKINSIYEVVQDIERKNNIIQSEYEKITDQQQINSLSIKSLIERFEYEIKNNNLTPELQNKDWLLAELEYLINLANTLYMLNENTQLTIIAYEQALYKLQNTRISGFENIKASIENELNALNLSIISSQEDKLNIIEKIIDQINLLPIMENSKSNNNNISLNLSWSQNFANEIKKRFQNIIIIKDYSSKNDLTSPKPADIVITAELRKMLYASKIAILNNRTEIYNELLINIIEWIKAYYDLDADKIIEILDLLEEALGNNSQYKKPDISKSLKMIKEYKLNMTAITNN